MSWNKYILDSSALLAASYQETGSDAVQSLLARSVMSSVNLAECVSVAVSKGVPSAEATNQFLAMVPTIIPFDQTMAVIAGDITTRTKKCGLSLGDRACLATAMQMNLEAVTADKIWGKLDLPIKIKIIR